MRRFCLLALLALLALLPVAALHAQAPDSAAAARPDTLRADLPGRPGPHRSPLMAGVLSYLVFPGAGHVYAGEYETAGVIVGTIVAGLYVAGQYGVEEQGCDIVCPVNGVFLAGIGAAFGAILYAHVDAPRAAARFNRRHARARQAHLSPALIAAPGGVQPGLSLRLTR
jgi:hypothetical protein